METQIKKPTQCNETELKDFEKLVIDGGQVELEGLLDRIKQCHLLAFGYSADKKLIGVSALKQKTKDSVERIQLKANVSSSEVPVIELGYSVTSKEFRGLGINKKLNDLLLEQIGNVSIFATTDNDAMRKYLPSRGFSKKGDSFKGKYNDHLEYLEKKKAEMVIVLVKWYIISGQEDKFKQTWIDKMEPEIKKGLFCEFFSKPIDSIKEKYHTLDVENKHYTTFINVGVWKDVESFDEAIGNFILGRKPHDNDLQKQLMEIYDFEYKLRERIVLTVEESRTGGWPLPSPTLTNKK